MKAERQFFEKILESSTSGWSVEMSPSLELGNTGLAAFSTRIYLVDTQHGWACASSVQPTIFEHATDLVRTGKASIKVATDGLAGAILDLGAKSLGAEKLEQSFLEGATFASAVYLLGTSTFEKAKLFGGEGHWIVLAYKMRDDSCLLRPVFFKDNAPALLPLEEFKGLVRQVTALDSSGPATNVGRMIQSCGGAVFSASEFAP